MNPKFEKEAHRFARGGSWYGAADSALMTVRIGFNPVVCLNRLGFRLCRDVPVPPDNSTPTRRSEDVQED